MTQNRHKQFEHEGEKLWAVFIPIGVEVESFCVHDPSLRLAYVPEAVSLMKEIAGKNPRQADIRGKWRELGSNATVALIRWAPVTMVIECSDIHNIPIGQMFEAQISKEMIAQRKIAAQVVLIRKWKGQMPNDRSTGNESGE